ncbi:MAG: helix-turn-helix transcriptional regulator [Saprospiraceae bacterium]|nr:helix-turn-helix transcriptional regulator [Saprospiraceae bacterium]
MVNNLSISDRFLHFLREKKISQIEFTQLTGIPQPTLSRFIAGKVKSPKAELIIALADNFPKLNLRWLLIGEGEMFTSNNEITIQELSDKLDLKENENESLRIELIKAKDKIIELLEK